MPADSTTSLMDVLQRYELLSASRIEELTRDPLDPSAGPQALAEQLVQRGWLTTFQTDRLLQGRGAELVLGNYLLLEQLGEGGMGQVFKARHRRMGRIVAVKLIPRKQLKDASVIRRFQREIEAAAQLEHPNVVRAYDADQAGDVHFFVMEYIEGIDLGKLVQRDGPLPVDRACEYIRQAAQGLQHAHECGLVHRDIKPANLLLTARDQTIKLLDLGLARMREDTEAAMLTREGALMGTPDFIAPEQARDAHTADIRADLYSLGCTFYYLLAAHVPFPGGSLAQKIYKQLNDPPAPLTKCRPDVPAVVSAVIERLMAKDPGDRYQSPAELVVTLTRLSQGRTMNTSFGVERPAEIISAVPFNTRCLQNTLSSSGGDADLSIIPHPSESQGAADTPPDYPRIGERRARSSTARRRVILAGAVLVLLAGGVLLAWKAAPPPALSSARNEPDTPIVAEPESSPVVAAPESPAQAAAALQQRGAILTRASSSLDAPVVRIDCSETAIRDADLAHLGVLPGLEQLYLYRTSISDAGLARLRGLANLQLLGLGQTPITGVGLTHLREMPGLRVLWLGRTKITDEGLTALAPLTRLRRLDLSGTAISDAGLAHLRGLAQLQTLDLSHTAIGDAGLIHLASLANLRQLNLQGSRVSEAGLARLPALPQLRTLDLTGTSVSQEAIEKLQIARPTLKVLR